MLLYTAIAHYHTSSIMGPEKVVAERIARLHITRNYAMKAEKISSGTSVHSLIQVHKELAGKYHTNTNSPNDYFI